MSTSEVQMRRPRKAEERHARDYEERMHDRWKADDCLREETDRCYAERLACTGEALAQTKEEMRSEATDSMTCIEVNSNDFARSADPKGSVTKSCSGHSSECRLVQVRDAIFKQPCPCQQGKPLHWQPFAIVADRFPCGSSFPTRGISRGFDRTFTGCDVLGHCMERAPRLDFGTVMSRQWIFHSALRELL